MESRSDTDNYFDSIQNMDDQTKIELDMLRRQGIRSGSWAYHIAVQA